MKKIVVATRNEGKLREYRALLGDLDLEILSLKDFPHLTLPEEEGESFLENAVRKARFVVQATGLPALGDDSGLEVDYLEGEPGVRSARFAGEPPDDLKNNLKLLQLLEGVPWDQRRARFRCILVLVLPHGGFFITEGVLEGYIHTEMRGDQGFGYDPIFYVPRYGKTLAELGEEMKNKISHRAKALEKMRPFLEGLAQ